MTCRILGSLGKKYTIYFDNSRGIYLYDDKRKITICELEVYREFYNRYAFVKVQVIESGYSKRMEAVYDVKEDIISDFYEQIEDFHLFNCDFYYIASLWRKDKLKIQRAIFRLPDELILGWYDKIYLFSEFVFGKSKYLICVEDERYKLIHYLTKEVLLEADFIIPFYITTPDGPYNSYFYIISKKNETKIGIFYTNEIKNVDLSPYLFEILKKRKIVLANGSRVKSYDYSFKFKKHKIKFRDEYFGLWCPSCKKYWYLYIQSKYSSKKKFCLGCELEKLNTCLL